MKARGIRKAMAVLVVAMASGCGGSQSAAVDPARQVAEANQRLQGTWVFMEFRPMVPLEPMFTQLLAMQAGRLTVQFDGYRMVATGIGVQASRTYRITAASMNHINLTLFDESGVAYETAGDFQDDSLRFESLTSPWTGYGLLRRTPGP